MRYLRPVVGMTVLAAVFGVWAMRLAPSFDTARGAATQQAALPGDADPAALERSALSAFTDFARLEARFDLAFLAYYHDKAAIHLHRLLPDGGAETLDYGRAGWAGLQKHWYADGAGRIAEDAGPAYSQLHTRVEGNLVIIEGRRRVEVENHTGSYKVAMVQTAGGGWKIIEEWIESQL